MNYILLLIETIIVLSIMIIFYRIGKKEGLFLKRLPEFPNTDIRKTMPKRS